MFCLVAELQRRLFEANQECGGASPYEDGHHCRQCEAEIPEKDQLKTLGFIEKRTNRTFLSCVDPGPNIGDILAMFTCHKSPVKIK